MAPAARVAAACAMALLAAAAVRQMAAQTPPAWRFARYVPSAWEREWAAFAASDEYALLKKGNPGEPHACARMMAPAERRRAKEMLDAVAVLMGDPPGPLWTRDVAEHPLLSKLVYASPDGEVSALIEPLVGHLRHPSHCLGEKALLLNTSYLLFDRRVAPPPGDPPGPPPPRAVVYFDLGATTYPAPDAPPEKWGTSQGFFPAAYARLGLPFSSMTLWDATEYKPADIFRHVPSNLLGGYAYFNVPVERIAVPGAWAAPDGKEFNALVAVRGKLAELRRILGMESPDAAPQQQGVAGDPAVYVVLKLDIGAIAVENSLAARLLDVLPGGGDPGPARTDQVEVHEFFFEHHTDIPDVIGPAWCRGNCPTLNQSYALFRAFRERGVRAHAWI
ncbi:hypothetical protein DFJ74DRAFT_701250 [Hyaloraphidium curvatum]|nr:hypothetical protein DFJ74DRAFT_701250 [Hyaloraphidium curvatum]